MVYLPFLVHSPLLIRKKEKINLVGTVNISHDIFGCGENGRLHEIWLED